MKLISRSTERVKREQLTNDVKGKIVRFLSLSMLYINWTFSFTDRLELILRCMYFGY